ncbi:MAG TPA: PepSY domain-containing protein [Luteimonas sp.]|nr:PepSY domain-containing protein [Luteimonas sp.]HRO26945.1 PepSY domain-containing protein [Luteimonas sp.]HRP73654.1 PepSY domain-containing protein [Luteimonas sp.]
MNAMLPLLAVVAVLATPAAIAGPKCTDAPRSEWLPEKSISDRLSAVGLYIDEFKVVDNCYVTRIRDRNGHKAEVHYNPADGHVVKMRGER